MIEVDVPSPKYWQTIPHHQSGKISGNIYTYYARFYGALHFLCCVALKERYRQVKEI